MECREMSMKTEMANTFSTTTAIRLVARGLPTLKGRAFGKPTAQPKPIGICRFTDGIHRIVYRDQGKEFVFDDEGNRVHGNWIASDDQLFDEGEADVPIVAKSVLAVVNAPDPEC
jgi:hypothetical protein